MPVNTTRTLKDEEAEKKHKLTKDWPVICYPIFFFFIMLSICCMAFFSSTDKFEVCWNFSQGELDFLGGIRDVPEFLPATSEFLA